MYANSLWNTSAKTKCGINQWWSVVERCVSVVRRTKLLNVGPRYGVTVFGRVYHLGMY